MSNNPFENNHHYTQLFRIRSSTYSCNMIETVELYKHKTKDYYILFRYMIDNLVMPVRTLLKFTDLLSVEVIQDGSQVELYVTTAYKGIESVTDKIGICCGSLIYVLQVEKGLYDHLL